MAVPLRMETLTDPAEPSVDEVVAAIRSWRGVSADQRAALRAAVAALPVVDWDTRDRPQPDRPLRVGEVAELLGVSRQHVRDMIRSGDLAAFRLSSNPRSEYRVLESTVRALIGGAA